MKKIVLIFFLITAPIVSYAETWAERKLPDGGYARVAYMTSDGALHVSIQTELKAEYVLDITVTCTHKWKTDDITNNDGTISPGTWKEEQYTICNNIYKDIPVNKIVTLTDGMNSPPANTRTDYYSGFNVSINNLMRTSLNTYRLVFYVWGKGTTVDSEISRTGHAFVYIPEIGHTGFTTMGDGSLPIVGEYVGSSGVIIDHSYYLKYATDSCAISISREQLDAVKSKLHQLQNNVPDYYVGIYDCTSFVMDIADAAGVQYGSRIDVQTPIYFMEKLKKHNTLNSK